MRRTPSLKTRLDKRTKKMDECLLYTGTLDKDGYGKITVGPRGAAKDLRAHRAVWELENGPIPKGKFILHRCSNPSCIRLEHLYLGTQFDNMKDRHGKTGHNRT